MIIIGEKINATRKTIAAALEARDESAIIQTAREQVAAGAHYLDINGGDPREGMEVKNMAWLIDVVQAAVRQAQGSGLDASTVDEAWICANLSTAGVPDPDLLIRTSGELRISNFLLWQVAYAELYFTPVLWPDFTSRDLILAIAEFARRERRYGGVLEDIDPGQEGEA